MFIAIFPHTIHYQSLKLDQGHDSTWINRINHRGTHAGIHYTLAIAPTKGTMSYIGVLPFKNFKMEQHESLLLIKVIYLQLVHGTSE